jgi:hypothetical protein
MQELKPVSSARELLDKFHSGGCLYALPDTHRIVSVELLESAVIAAYLSCPEISLELKAIIDKEPTQ